MNKEAVKVIKEWLPELELMARYNTSSIDYQRYKALNTAIEALEQEQKTGHWIEIAQYSDGKHKIECSECKSHIFDRGHANSFNVKNRYKYCPNCGCRMFEPQEG